MLLVDVLWRRVLQTNAEQQLKIQELQDKLSKVPYARISDLFNEQQLGCSEIKRDLRVTEIKHSWCVIIYVFTS